MKILKAKPWMIKFYSEATDQKYFIKTYEDGYETLIHLYKFDCDKNGKYTTEFIDGCYGHISLFDSGVRTKHGQTYKDANTGMFCSYLASLGFGKYIGMNKKLQEWFLLNLEIINTNNKITHLKQQIEYYENKLLKIQQQQSDIIVTE